jgi:lipoprotein-releasing system ATP-binding protein
MSDNVLELRGLERRYRSGDGELAVLQGADLSIAAGEMVALVAPSGTGKSTLLHLAGLLERPDAGEVVVCGRRSERISEAERTETRRARIGFVYQAHHLLAEFTALENVVLPQLVGGTSRRDAVQRARELLGAFGLSGRESHLPGKLSGGEQQRVAIARALANGPSLLLADEPTGNLDVETAEVVFAELIRLAREHRVGALIATHNRELAARMDRTLTLDRGKIRAA